MGAQCTLERNPQEQKYNVGTDTVLVHRTSLNLHRIPLLCEHISACFRYQPHPPHPHSKVLSHNQEPPATRLAITSVSFPPLSACSPSRGSQLFVSRGPNTRCGSRSSELAPRRAAVVQSFPLYLQHVCQSRRCRDPPPPSRAAAASPPLPAADPPVPFLGSKGCKSLRPLFLGLPAPAPGRFFGRTAG